MPFCPKCKYEYREGIEVCPDCDARLVRDLPEEPPPEVEDIPVQLVRVSEMYEADIIRGTLQSAGIPAMVQPDAGSVLWDNQRSLSQGGTIYVPSSKYEQAIRILQRASNGGNTDR